jgi:hypothetical protein
VASESREARERVKVLKRVRVKSTGQPLKLKKPLEQYAPIQRAITQRNDALAQYRAILQHLARAQEEHDRIERELQQADEEAALYFIQFLMLEADWRE